MGGERRYNFTRSYGKKASQVQEMFLPPLWQKREEDMHHNEVHGEEDAPDREHRDYWLLFVPK